MSEPATWYAFCVPSTPRTTVSTLPSVEVTLRTSSSIKMYLQTEAQKAAALSTNTSVSFGRRATGSPSSSTFESVVTLPVLLYSSGAFCSPCSQIRQSSLYWSPLAPRYFSGQSAARAVAATSAQTSGPRHLMAAVVGPGPVSLGRKAAPGGRRVRITPRCIAPGRARLCAATASNESKRQRAGFSRKAARKPVPPAHRDRRRRGAGLRVLRVATRLTAPRAPPARSSTATAAA